MSGRILLFFMRTNEECFACTLEHLVEGFRWDGSNESDSADFHIGEEVSPGDVR